MKSTGRKIQPIILVRYLFFVTAAILCILGAGTFMRISGNPQRVSLYLVYGVLMLADSAALLVCGLLMKRPGRSIFWLAAGVLGINVLSTIADQFGMIDLLILLLNIITLVMLIKSRREFAV